MNKQNKPFYKIKIKSKKEINNILTDFILNLILEKKELKKYNYNTMYIESIINIYQNEGLSKFIDFLDNSLYFTEDFKEILEKNYPNVKNIYDFNKFPDLDKFELYKFLIQKELVDNIGFLEILDIDKKEYSFNGPRESKGLILISYKNNFIDIVNFNDIVLEQSNEPPFFMVKLVNFEIIN